MSTTTIEDLKRLAGLEPYRRYLDLKSQPDGNYKAVCPFHNDKNPSLVVYKTADHHCFACEAHGDALDLIQHLDSCDMKTARERLEEIVGVSAPKIPQGPGEIKAVYRYTDEEGELLFEVVRYDPKGFRQRRPDPNGDGMIWNLSDVRRPLYRLPEVLKAPVVWVLEGEKDADTAYRMSQVGTTTAGGASSPWLSEHTDALTGKTVFLVPDNDDPGRRRAERVREALEGAADEVVIVAIPEPHKDLTDYVNAGATREDLQQLVTTARAAEKVRWWQGATSLSRLRSKEITYMIPDILHEGSLTMIVGKPGSYKSFVALDIAKCVAAGIGFAGRKPCSGPRPVLYLDAENGLPIVVARRNFLGIPPNDDLKYWGRFDDRPMPAIDDPDLLQFAREEKPLLIFDSFIRFHKGSENDNAEVAATMGKFLDLKNAGATVLLLHHSGKDTTKQFRGAQELEAAPDVCMTATKVSEGMVQLEDFKNRLGPDKTIDLKLMEMGFVGLASASQEDDDAL